MKLNCAIILCCFFLACSSKKDIPSTILTQKEMKEVIWDMMRADQYLGNYVFTRDSSVNRTSESLLFYQRIFKLHNITKDRFMESFNWYRARPVLFKSIMDSISVPTETAPFFITPSPGKTVPSTTPEFPDTLQRKKKMIPLAE
jgi:hypothetical protein